MTTTFFAMKEKPGDLKKRKNKFNKAFFKSFAGNFNTKIRKSTKGYHLSSSEKNCGFEVM